MSEEEVMNRFFENFQRTITNIPDNLKQNYINYEVSKLSKLVKSNYTNTYLNYFFEIKKIAGDYSFKKGKIKYYNNDCDIILIAQYYKTNAKDKKENDVCLINNIINDAISKIHLLNEQEYDLEYILSKLKPEHIKKSKTARN